MLKPQLKIVSPKAGSLTCIFHNNCADGFGAAWVVKKMAEATGDKVFYHGGIYQKEPPWNLIDRQRVVIVDFSYKRPVMEEIYKRSRSLTWIDHHKSAIEDMKGFGKGKPSYTEFISLEHSGAVLAWLYYFGEPAPLLLRHIEDRDLWKFQLEGTREIQANLFSYPYNFDLWDDLMISNVEDLIQEGRAIERKHFKDIKELLAVVVRWTMIGDHYVPVANLPYTMASDAGHMLCDANPQAGFAATYYDKEEGRVFSLRSLDNGTDVSVIAKQYGGGGHQHAAGFEVNRRHHLATF